VAQEARIAAVMVQSIAIGFGSQDDAQADNVQEAIRIQ
jgi:hypothetical protein